MKYFNESEISIRQMQCFLVVAEQSSFSRAAVMLNMGQSTLSKCISLLERTLGIKLFRRELRPISLTPAGEVLYDSWKQLVEAYNQSLDEAFARSNQMSRQLTVGLVDSINTLHFMPKHRKMLIENNPGLDLRFEYCTFSSWRSKLKNGEVDLVLTVLFELGEIDPGFETTKVSSCEKSVCMLKSNPLTQLPSVQMSDLRDQRFIVIAPEESPAYYSYIRGLCVSHGFEPKVSRFIDNAHGLFNALQADDEVIICDRYFRDYNNALIHKFLLPDVTSGLAAVWKRGNANRFISTFVRQLQADDEL